MGAFVAVPSGTVVCVAWWQLGADLRLTGLEAGKKDTGRAGDKYLHQTAQVIV